MFIEYWVGRLQGHRGLLVFILFAAGFLDIAGCHLNLKQLIGIYSVCFEDHPFTQQ
uniref:Uncharacterized protein n=1 Tax=Arundo donax TaxID=35708 RepID=A0A0A8ZCW5_ARUDO